MMVHCGGAARRTGWVKRVQPLYAVHSICASRTQLMREVWRLCAGYSLCTPRTDPVDSRQPACIAYKARGQKSPSQLTEVGMVQIVMSSSLQILRREHPQMRPHRADPASEDAYSASQFVKTRNNGSEPYLEVELFEKFNFSALP